MSQYLPVTEDESWSLTSYQMPRVELSPFSWLMHLIIVVVILSQSQMLWVIVPDMWLSQHSLPGRCGAFPMMLSWEASVEDSSCKRRERLLWQHSTISLLSSPLWSVMNVVLSASFVRRGWRPVVQLQETNSERFMHVTQTRIPAEAIRDTHSP